MLHTCRQRAASPYLQTGKHRSLMAQLAQCLKPLSSRYQVDELSISSLPRLRLGFRLAIRDMEAVVQASECLSAAPPSGGCRGALGDDLAAATRARLYSAGAQDMEQGKTAKAMKRRKVESLAAAVVHSTGFVIDPVYRDIQEEAREDARRRTPQVASVSCSYILYVWSVYALHICNYWRQDGQIAFLPADVQSLCDQ